MAGKMPRNLGTKWSLSAVALRLRVFIYAVFSRANSLLRVGSCKIIAGFPTGIRRQTADKWA